MNWFLKTKQVNRTADVKTNILKHEVNTCVKDILKRSVKLVFASGMMAGALLWQSAQAAHGTYNPMSPRQISAKAAQADYTYGYSILAGHAIDTLEEPNRMMWYLNYDILDYYILRPVAVMYSKTPEGFQSSVGNFLSNLGEVNNIPNNLLVGEVGASGKSFGRFIINSTIGIVGLFDVASHLGLEHSPMAMSTVLGRGGMQQGPYFMVPAYGLTTARDVHGSTIDGLPWLMVSWPITLSKWAVQGVHVRAGLLAQEDVVANALDPYQQARDVYLMHGENKVNPVADGEVEVEDDFDESLLDEIDG